MGTDATRLREESARGMRPRQSMWSRREQLLRVILLFERGERGS